MKSFCSLLTLYVSNAPSIILLYADDCMVFQNWTNINCLPMKLQQMQKSQWRNVRWERVSKGEDVNPRMVSTIDSKYLNMNTENTKL